MAAEVDSHLSMNASVCLYQCTAVVVVVMMVVAMVAMVVGCMGVCFVCARACF